MSKIDYVITELEVAIQNPEFPYGQYIGLIFIDQKPGFPKVESTLRNIEEHLENTPMKIHSHSKVTHPITQYTDLSGLEIVKH